MAISRRLLERHFRQAVGVTIYREIQRVRVVMNALDRRGYAGPVRAEPFNRALNDLDNEPACAATIEALKKAVALMSRPS